MSSPPHDESDDTPPDDSEEPGAHGSNEDESVAHDPGIGPRGDSSAESGEDTPERDEALAEPAESATTEPVEPTPDFDDPVGDLLPRASVDSRWWYWIAAVPLYVVLGGVLAVLFLGAFLFDLFLTGGLATLFGAFIVIPVLGLVGLVLSVMYPIATYIDARAIAASDSSWTPDPIVWGLAALATEVLSAFTLSVVLALYYLYKRHVEVGTP